MTQSRLNEKMIFLYPCYITINTLSMMSQQVCRTIALAFDMCNLKLSEVLEFVTNPLNYIPYSHRWITVTQQNLCNDHGIAFKENLTYAHIPSKLHPLLHNLCFDLQWPQWVCSLVRFQQIEVYKKRKRKRKKKKKNEVKRRSQFKFLRAGPPSNTVKNFALPTYRLFQLLIFPIPFPSMQHMPIYFSNLQS